MLLGAYGEQVVRLWSIWLSIMNLAVYVIHIAMYFEGVDDLSCTALSNLEHSG
jgi:hypothetical protein